METQTVLAFAGHMIDQPGRPSPRFPSEVEEMVRASIRETIHRIGPYVAISSAACGGDIIFAEEILRYGASLYVILPFSDREEFIQQSVAPAGQVWIERFNRICEESKTHPYFVKSGGYANDRDFEDNQRALVFFGLGLASGHNMRLMGLVLCDEAQLGSEIGGTRSFLEMCIDLNISYETIDMATLRSPSQLVHYTSRGGIR